MSFRSLRYCDGYSRHFNDRPRLDDKNEAGVSVSSKVMRDADKTKFANANLLSAREHALDLHHIVASLNGLLLAISRTNYAQKK